MIYGGIQGVLRAKVPAACAARQHPREVPWLLMCAWLCYRGDALSEAQTMNQRCQRYIAEHDPAVYRR